MAPSDPRPCYVYVLWGEGSHFIKIGHAYDVEGRKSVLQTGSPFKLRTLMAISLPDAEEADQQERRLHAHFTAIRVEGEWFDLPKDTTKSFELLVQITTACQSWARPNSFIGVAPRLPARSKYLEDDLLRILQRVGREVELREFHAYLVDYWPLNLLGHFWTAVDNLAKYGRIQQRTGDGKEVWFWYDPLLDTSDVLPLAKPDWLYEARSASKMPRTSEMAHEQIDQEIDELFCKYEEPVEDPFV